LVRSICLRPPESGDEFGVGKGWFHKAGRQFGVSLN
jgi:hypothetical protein